MAHKVRQLADLLGRLGAREAPEPVSLQRFREGYVELGLEERAALFEHVLELEVPKGEISERLREVLATSTSDAATWTRSLTALRRDIESPRLRALRRFLNSPGGLTFLLHLRADVIQAERQAGSRIDPLNEELAHLLNTWFRHGFLFLQEITAESPFGQIRFLKDHDFVHPMASLEEMGHRLGADRRCFALYHRAMPEEPVVFIEVALTRGIATSIHDIIADAGATAAPGGGADTAIFYSINNTQNGLAGLGLGKVLVFRVVEAIQQDHPEIETFATLSPITGFWRRYLEPILRGEQSSFQLDREALLERYFPLRTRQLILRHLDASETPGDEDASAAETADARFCSVLARALADRDWIDDPVLVRTLRRPLVEIAHFYLSEEKNHAGKPLNPVAGFHLGNGARLDARHVHFGANRTPRGLQDSLGLMVNYVYVSSGKKELGRTMRSLLPFLGR